MGKHKKIMPSSKGSSKKKMHMFSKVTMMSQKGGAIGKPGPNASSSTSSRRRHQAQTIKQNQQARRPVIPFRSTDRILLVGEGDFTFALSLASHHGCRLMLATCYDTEEVLYSKYHEARSTLDKLRSCGQGSADVDEDGQGIRNSNNLSKSYPVSPRVLFGVDCRKLGSPAGGGQAVRAGFRGINRERDRGIPAKPVGGPWDVIVFNFPHVGGLSTDVNRQVRANQELLVTFFKACVPLLSYPNSPDSDEYYDDSDSDDLPFISDDERNFSRSKKEPGKIIVTLFEQEPYTLWNIRDLARHVGLRVVTSFRFPWTSYPGYSHARTIGDIKSQGSERRGWRGEERAARSYIFECKGFDKLSDTRQKRKRHSQESDED